MTTTTEVAARMAQAIDAAPPGASYLAICAQVAIDVAAEHLTAAELNQAGLAAWGERILADSATWFPKVYARGHDAVTTHLGYGLGGEAGEVLEVLKKADVCGWDSSCDMHAPGKHDRAALTGELADVLTYLLALARHLGIDLTEAYADKRATNVARWGDPALTRCAAPVGSRPSWMSPDQYDPCRCALAVGHEGPHLCRHDLDGPALVDGLPTIDELDQGPE